MAIHYSSKRWQDQVILLIGLWLFISPWAMNYPSEAPQSINAHVVGLLMAALAAFDLYRTYLWAVVLNLVLGLWMVAAPWAMQYNLDRPLTIDSVVVGLAVLVLGLWELRSDPELHQQWAGAGPPLN